MSGCQTNVFYFSFFFLLNFIAGFEGKVDEPESEPKASEGFQSLVRTCR